MTVVPYQATLTLATGATSDFTSLAQLIPLPSGGRLKAVTVNATTDAQPPVKAAINVLPAWGSPTSPGPGVVHVGGWVRGNTQNSELEDIHWTGDLPLQSQPKLYISWRNDTGVTIVLLIAYIAEVI